MDIALIIIGAILMLVGIIGCIVPALPGVPLSYAGLLLLQLTDKVQFSWQFLVIWGVVTVAVTVFDTVAPAWLTKRTGGSKRAVWGSTIGLIIGLFTGPWGVILLPFVGAVIAELMGGKQSAEAIKAGMGAFLGLLTGTILKLICSGLMTYYFIAELI